MLSGATMRPDYCPVAKEPCQAMCDPKCRLRKPPTDRELAAAYTNAQSQAPKHLGHKVNYIGSAVAVRLIPLHREGGE